MVKCSERIIDIRMAAAGIHPLLPTYTHPKKRLPIDRAAFFLNATPFTPLLSFFK
jgi:hypothetical protein